MVKKKLIAGRIRFPAGYDDGMLIPSFPAVTAGENTGDSRLARRREKESGGDEIKIGVPFAVC